jgi:hypothetical protein
MIKGLFDVYNLGTASTLRVEGIDIAGKQVRGKFCQNWREKSSTEGSLYFCSICT